MTSTTAPPAASPVSSTNSSIINVVDPPESPLDVLSRAASMVEENHGSSSASGSGTAASNAASTSASPPLSSSSTSSTSASPEADGKRVKISGEEVFSLFLFPSSLLKSTFIMALWPLRPSMLYMPRPSISVSKRTSSCWSCDAWKIRDDVHVCIHLHEHKHHFSCRLWPSSFLQGEASKVQEAERHARLPEGGHRPTPGEVRRSVTGGGR